MKLKYAFTVELEAIPPYSFELTLRKPAGWYWSTPEELFDEGTCWSATRFNGELRSKTEFYRNNPQTADTLHNLFPNKGI